MPQSKTPKEHEDDFYESMSATADHFFPADDPAEYSDDHTNQPGLDEIKITAIITIALVMLAGIGLALLLFGALEVMRSVLPS